MQFIMQIWSCLCLYFFLTLSSKFRLENTLGLFQVTNSVLKSLSPVVFIIIIIISYISAYNFEWSISYYHYLLINADTIFSCDLCMKDILILEYRTAAFNVIYKTKTLKQQEQW